jgi:hypothetical protein
VCATDQARSGQIANRNSKPASLLKQAVLERVELKQNVRFGAMGMWGAALGFVLRTISLFVESSEVQGPDNENRHTLRYR